MAKPLDDRSPVEMLTTPRPVLTAPHVTVAERPLDPARYPGADPALLSPGSLVFFPTSGPADLVFAWGDDPAPKGRVMASTWQGQFPWTLPPPTSDSAASCGARRRTTLAGL